MPERAFLREVTNEFIAEMYVADLEAAGFRAIIIQPLFPNLPTPVEIWLMDGADLNRPDAKQVIDAIFEPAVMAVEDEGDGKGA